MKVAAAIQNAIQCYYVIYDKKKKKELLPKHHWIIFSRVGKTESSKEPEPGPLTSGVSEIAACPLSPIDSTLYYLLSLLLSSSTCLFTQCQPHPASACIALLYFLRYLDCAKACDCVDHNKLWRILKEMGIPDHLACLLRNLYAGQEAMVRTGHGATDGSK